jgi:membrane protease YdiL (CAAX protease family)
MNIFKALLATFLLVSIEVILALGFHFLTHHIAVNPENLLQYNGVATIVIKLLQYSIVLLIVYRSSFKINALPVKVETIQWKVLLLIFILSIGFEILNHIFLDIKLFISSDTSYPTFLGIPDYISKNISILDLTSAIILAPVLEELFFRKMMFSRLLKKYSFTISAVVSSLCFTLIHIPHWFNLVPVFLFGMICCFIYVKTKNILYPIFFHFTGNLIVSLPWFFNQESFSLGQKLNYNWLYWSIMVAGIGLTLLGLRRISKIRTV